MSDFSGSRILVHLLTVSCGGDTGKQAANRKRGLNYEGRIAVDCEAKLNQCKGLAQEPCSVVRGQITERDKLAVEAEWSRTRQDGSKF